MPRSDTDGSSLPYFLEAHYYSGGLRFKHLGGPRPIWAPEPSRVGFRNEIDLREADAVIEFYRMENDGHPITWLAIFFRSPDRKFGDRQNHAGAGLWLNGYQITDADKLLRGLEQFARGVANAGEADELEHDASVFLADKFVGSYVVPTDEYAQQLRGWPYASQGLSETEIFVAQSPELDAAWKQAAEQILRLTFLPAPSARHSRALIVVTDKELELRPVSGHKALSVKGNFAKEILDLIPKVASETRRSNSELTDRLSSSDEQVRLLGDRLAKSEALNAEARQSLATLRAEVEANDVLSTLIRLAGVVEDVKQLGSSTKDYIRELVDTAASNTNILKRIEIHHAQTSSNKIKYENTPFKSDTSGTPKHKVKEFPTGPVTVGILSVAVIIILLILILRRIL
ncbi:MAG: hypothetical protein JWL96_2858 [Sphingomonas bacterium]|uniref:hypothetical protein n=1 Tax=Sphingomonas bacterium TaxID=1895847 RepID=UPI00262062E0|nr:hypothetical protein [Sphingomonas bacterium]MDB5710788.1 hypothetical protein [Sphingomonas bacterium]